jgi:predicted ATPase
VMGLLYASKGYQLLDRFQVVQSMAEELLHTSKEHGYILFQALGLVQRGWSLAAQGQFERGIDDMQQGIDRLRQHKLIFTLPESISQLAEALARSGQVQMGLSKIEEGIAISLKIGVTHWLAEMHRLKGEMLLKEGSEAGAEEYFLKAIAAARQQQARSWELRAASSLACLRQAQGRRSEAYNLLQSIYDWFTEGFETADLIQARALLVQLKRVQPQSVGDN